MKTPMAAAPCPACAALRDAIALRLADLGTDAARTAWVIYGTDANANAVAERVKRMRRERAEQ